MAPSSPSSRRGFARVLIPFSPSTTYLQATTYLLGISLFSISFLVFLNSAVSFVITDLLGTKSGVGDIVGTLGFVDEVVALVACPAWGLASDRLGVRWVAVLGYTVIGVSLFVFVQAAQVYPDLVFLRILFALGATAAATMVTAVLPVLTDDKGTEAEEEQGVGGGGEGDGQVGGQRDAGEETESEERRSHNPRDSVAMSLESDATITPERFSRTESRRRLNGRDADGGGKDDDDDDKTTGGKGNRPAALAGYVGLFTGCGALVALVLFLPLPAQFSRKEGVTPAQAITDSFYVVGTIAFGVAIFVFFGLRGLKGEEGKGWRMLLGTKLFQARGEREDALPATEEDSNHIAPHTTTATRRKTPTAATPLPYHLLLLTSLRLGVSDPHIALGYLGGFVARASTVAISLFIPLYVNAYYINHGFCTGSPTDPSPELKKECRAAYILASTLTGAAQLCALLAAPLFGWVGNRGLRVRIPAVLVRGSERRPKVMKVNIGIVIATLFGVVGYAVFPRLASPEFRDVDGRGGSAVVFLVAALVGVSQIGAIVCSLGSLGRGVLKSEGVQITAPLNGVVSSSSDGGVERDEDGESETRPLLHDHDRDYGHGHEQSSNTSNGDHGHDHHREIENENRGSCSGSGTRKSDHPQNQRKNTFISRVQLKGSIAGVYSWCGGAAILLLTKLGGYLFDVTSTGAPFYMMAAFNAVLLVVSLGVDVGRWWVGSRRRRERGQEGGERERERG